MIVLIVRFVAENQFLYSQSAVFSRQLSTKHFFSLTHVIGFLNHISKMTTKKNKKQANQ